MAEKKTTTIVQDHQKNFETLRQAFLSGDACLMDCVEKSTGEHVAVICAVFKEVVPQASPVHTAGTNEEYTFTPFAKFFNGNPYELLSSPIEYEKGK